MNLEKKRSFIINILYYGLMVLIVFVLLKYALPLLGAVRDRLCDRLSAQAGRFALCRSSSKPTANWSQSSWCSCFYCTIGLLLVLLSIKAFTAAGDFLQRVPSFYTWRVEPMLMNIFDGIEQSVLSMDEIAGRLAGGFVEQLRQLARTDRLHPVRSAITVLSGLAGSLPGLFVKLLLMIISTFFIAVDYDRLRASSSAS